ncbi:MAG: DNA (cytosine-5)-methyltransferase 1 [Myxococcota bacterium]|jgi:DNA (cytosine-5)-methyltransferase 1
MDSSSHRGTVCGLFAGVGGLELGLSQSGWTSELLCEIDPDAQTVLRTRLPGVALHDDVTTLQTLPAVDVLTAGFPCQDLSMAGQKVGIGGARSGLVAHLLELLRTAKQPPTWLVIENVPYMLSLNGGAAMQWLTGQLEALGFGWAYRVVDARSMGVPQRRLRVLLVASRTQDPCRVLFADDVPEQVDDSTSIADDSLAYGFYWTEGRRGLGWAVDGVPTIKGGSTIGIPSPPAIWVRATGEIGTPDIRDLERMQGFPADWTGAADSRARWRLIGNAVCVPVAAWLGRRLANPGDVVCDSILGRPRRGRVSAAFGGPGLPFHTVACSRWPMAVERPALRDFLEYPLKPLSLRATRGYLSRAEQSTALRFSPGFLPAVRSHLAQMRAA